MGDPNRTSIDSQDCEDELLTALYALNRARSNTDDAHLSADILEIRDDLWAILQRINPTRHVD